MPSKNYYQVLQVDQAASIEVIEAAYRRLARIYHPDVNKLSDAGTQMQALNQAYECLKDAARRQTYDAKRRAEAEAEARRQQSTSSQSSRTSSSSRDSSASSASQRTTSQSSSTGNTPRAHVSSNAQLSRQVRSGSDIIISIGRASDFTAVLSELKRCVPSSARSYDAATKSWRISDRYEQVLRDLFCNYAPDAPSAAVNSTGAYSSAGYAHYATGTPSRSSDSASRYAGSHRKTGESQSAVGWVVALAIAAVIGYFVFRPADPTSTRPSQSNEPAATPIAAVTSDEMPARSSVVVLNELDVPTATASPSGCAGGCTIYPTWCAPPIKGNVAYETGERIYHLPGQEYYDATRIDTRYGERWFCSEAEAVGAGWRKARN